MAKKRKRHPVPRPETLEDQAITLFQQNSASMRPQAFRDALTRASGAVRGVPTHAIQWDRKRT